MPGEQAFKHEEKPKFYSKKTKYIFFPNSTLSIIVYSDCTIQLFCNKISKKQNHANWKALHPAFKMKQKYFQNRPNLGVQLRKTENVQIHF